MDKIEYRTESCYGSCVRDLAEIITYEIEDLGNEDILDGIVENGLIPDSSLDVAPHETIGDAVVRKINETTGKEYKYGLWLARLDAVKSLYDGADSDIDAYETSDAVLADLGYDGRLYAYENMPTPI